MKHEQREQTNQFNVVLTRENTFQNTKYLSKPQKTIIKLKAKLSHSNKQKSTENLHELAPRRGVYLPLALEPKRVRVCRRAKFVRAIVSVVD